MSWFRAWRRRKSDDELIKLIDERISAARGDHDQLLARVQSVEARLSEPRFKPSSERIFRPLPSLYETGYAAPFMVHSTCSTSDFLHPRYAQACLEINIPQKYHRKYWEWVFILNTARRFGVSSGARALGFGVGAEPIPAALAKLGVYVTATDAPAEIGIGQGWRTGGDYAQGVGDLPLAGITDADTMRSLVVHRVCDMNCISDDLKDFDFCWSSCSLEHLGTLQHGLDFIQNSIETLKVGGVACHTTEFNLSSDDATVESGPTVIYRKRDLDRIVAKLRNEGHTVDDISIAPDVHHLDSHVDFPPYSPHGHLKLDLMGHTATSIAIVIQKGTG